MADIFLLNSSIKFVALAYKTLSGNVLASTLPVARQILIYKNYELTPSTITTSDSTTGNWSVNVVSNNNDVFRVVIVGRSGEYSKIFEDVVAG